MAISTPATAGVNVSGGLFATSLDFGAAFVDCGYILQPWPAVRDPDAHSPLAFGGRDADDTSAVSWGGWRHRVGLLDWL